jgi:phosphonate transport system permease protein
MSQPSAPVAEAAAPSARRAPPKPPIRLGRWILAALCISWLLVWSFTGVQGNLRDLVDNRDKMADTLSRMLPPDTTLVTDPKVYDTPPELSTPQLLLPLPLDIDKAKAKEYWWVNTFPQTVVGATLQTIQMAVAGTTMALVVAFPLGFLAARNTSPHPAVYHGVKLATNLFRTIPDIAWCLVLIAAVGLGPFAGTLALALHTATVLVKLFAESIENIDEGVVEALKATGAKHMQVLSFAVVPQVMPSFISFLLYRFETNIRAAAVLGLIGAGGIGFLMNTNFRMFQYPQASMTVVVLIVLVMIVDYASAQLRKMVT